MLDAAVAVRWHSHLTAGNVWKPGPVWSLPAWVLSKYGSSLPQSKDVHTRLAGNCKLVVGGCWVEVQVKVQGNVCGNSPDLILTTDYRFFFFFFLKAARIKLQPLKKKDWEDVPKTCIWGQLETLSWNSLCGHTMNWYLIQTVTMDSP